MGAYSDTRQKQMRRALERIQGQLSQPIWVKLSKKLWRNRQQMDGLIGGREMPEYDRFLSWCYLDNQAVMVTHHRDSGFYELWRLILFGFKGTVRRFGRGGSMPGSSVAGEVSAAAFFTDFWSNSIVGIALPISFSMAPIYLISSLPAAIVNERPDHPARPVRPIRWT